MQEVIIQISGDNGVLVTNSSVYVGPGSIVIVVFAAVFLVLLMTKWSKTKDRLLKLVPQGIRAWSGKRAMTLLLLRRLGRRR
jgi:hypothetical protein